MTNAPPPPKQVTIITPMNASAAPKKEYIMYCQPARRASGFVPCMTSGSVESVRNS